MRRENSALPLELPGHDGALLTSKNLSLSHLSRHVTNDQTLRAYRPMWKICIKNRPLGSCIGNGTVRSGMSRNAILFFRPLMNFVPLPVEGVYRRNSVKLFPLTKLEDD